MPNTNPTIDSFDWKLALRKLSTSHSLLGVWFMCHHFIRCQGKPWREEACWNSELAGVPRVGRGVVPTGVGGLHLGHGFRGLCAPSGHPQTREVLSSQQPWSHWVLLWKDCSVQEVWSDGNWKQNKIKTIQANSVEFLGGIFGNSATVDGEPTLWKHQMWPWDPGMEHSGLSKELNQECKRLACTENSLYFLFFSKGRTKTSPNQSTLWISKTPRKDSSMEV